MNQYCHYFALRALSPSPFYVKSGEFSKCSKDSGNFLASHSPDFDGLILERFLMMEDFFIPGRIGLVEDDQMTLVCATPIHILFDLWQPFVNGGLARSLADFQFQHNALNTGRVGEPDKQIGATFAKAVFAVDMTAAVDHSLQECL